MTRAEWFIRRYAAQWRTARVTRRCDCRPVAGLRCTVRINRGDRYLDTRMNTGPSPHYCAECAQAELPATVGV
jgi:hypothetical protein